MLVDKALLFGTRDTDLSFTHNTPRGGYERHECHNSNVLLYSYAV